jgi:Cu/Ag efflux protein CusF
VGQSARAGAPQTITGEVVKIDQNSGMVTLRAADGTTHEFRANKQTLRDLKIGDNLEAKLRTTNC